MKQFLAIYLGSASSANRDQWDKLEEAAPQAEGAGRDSGVG
jgi:hypothetical protein